jgi:CMP-N,N'-diacetyllegionaminic acid synthase
MKKVYSSSVIGRKKVLCIIPARAGSVGIKHKNLQLIHEKSLVGWAVTIATKVDVIDKVVISTDSLEIAEEAMKHGGTFLKLRSTELSGPNIHDQQVLIETLSNSETALNSEFEIIMMLQPTSPLRSIEEINKCLIEVALLNKTACWTISKVDAKYHYRKQLRIGEDSVLQMSVEGPRVVNRQELSQTYIRNGACYVFTRETLLNDPQLLGNNCGYVISDGVRPNIDVIEELRHAIEISCINSESGLLEEKREPS